MKINETVLNVLANAQTEGNALKLVGQLDRTTYTAVNKVLEAAGGKWNRKAGAHLFEGDAAELVDRIVLVGEIAPPQKFGYFPTPEPVVDRLMELAQVEEHMLALEPSAGKGDIAKRLVMAGAAVQAYELQEVNCERLRALGLGALTVAEPCDFLTVAPEPRYDRVVMNPPFEKQADIHHVLHALKFLNAGGLLVSVMSASVAFRDNKLTTDFRDLIRARGGDIEALPEGSFKASGTGVNTVIVTIPAGA